jgi:hypothetical protein
MRAGLPRILYIDTDDLEGEAGEDEQVYGMRTSTDVLGSLLRPRGHHGNARDGRAGIRRDGPQRR